MSFLTTFSDEASKTYKDAARTATTGPINLLSAPASIGSVSLNLNDRVLVKDQANAAPSPENGIYVFKGAGNPMVRSTDANSDREVLPNMLISVSEGDYEDKIFELTTNGPISLGVTPLSFGLAILPIDLTTDVVGVLPVANGGTNRASWTEGRVVFAGASGSALAEDSNLNWDNSNKQLGIGTSTPQTRLEVRNPTNYDIQRLLTLSRQEPTRYNAYMEFGNVLTGADFQLVIGTRNNYVDYSTLKLHDGNVGIGLGTASPSEKLEVAGNAKAEGLLLQSRHNLTGAVTVLSNDYYVGCNSSGGAVTVALQSAATAKQGRKLVIKAESSLANVTINAAAGETIDGSASHVLNVSYESVTLVCNGANAWFIV